ncbi:hypothetical protein [Bradyrhizobium prioriisuperbiae]|uniref:hypothetical protein n=1 Tax=Bradyrhizobium prioriisuperbiae TaxID=2854389 RepID=UPI0028EB55C9|nr:hypothetical protein [Bradyrhizobium prioritasuperba]
MRRLMFAVATVAALAGAGTLAGGRAEAMPLTGASHLAGTAAEPVYLRCRRLWNGYRWERSCVDIIRPGYGYYGGYGPGYGYGYGRGYGYGGGYGYYGGWRPRYYGYY